MFRWRLQNIFSNMVMFGVQFEEQNVILFWPYISNASQMTWIKWQEQFHLWHLRWLSSFFSITRRSRLPKNKHKQNEKKHLRTVWKENAIQCKFIYFLLHFPFSLAKYPAKSQWTKQQPKRLQQSSLRKTLRNHWHHSQNNLWHEMQRTFWPRHHLSFIFLSHLFG